MAKAKRYAQALFALAQEKGREQPWFDELRDATRVLLANEEVKLLLTTPRISEERKLDAVREALRGKDPLVVNLIGVLITRQSIGILPEVTGEYGALLDESLGRVYASVTAAVALSLEQRRSLEASLRESLGKDVVLDIREDPSIIGGLVVRVGDQVIDGSVRTKLESMRLRLAQDSLA